MFGASRCDAMLESAPVTSHDLILNATTLMLNADAVDPRLKDDEFAVTTLLMTYTTQGQHCL